MRVPVRYILHKSADLSRRHPVVKVRHDPRLGTVTQTYWEAIEQRPEPGETPTTNMEVAGVQVRAVSRGGICTTLTFPEFDLTVDLGVQTKAASRTSTIALTHTHTDHIAGLPMYLGTRNIRQQPRPRIIVPADMAPTLRTFIETLETLQGGPLNYTIVPIHQHEEIALGKDLVLRAFGTVHRVPSTGYVVIRRRQKLRDEYVGLPPKEVARLRKERGDALFRLDEQPIVAVTGDSTASGMDLEDPYVRNAKVLFVEATYLEDFGRDTAEDRGHARVDELFPRLAEHPAERIVLYHFSERYTAEQIAALRTRLPSDLARRVMFLA